MKMSTAACLLAITLCGCGQGNARTSDVTRAPAPADAPTAIAGGGKIATAPDAAPEAAPAARAPASGEALLARAEHSFSALGFGQRGTPQSLGLRIDPACDGNAGGQLECNWIDRADVRYLFYADGPDETPQIVVKSILARDFGARAIPALGIGTARTRAEVVRKVGAFLGGTAITCLDSEAAGEGPGISSCGATLGEDWIKLLFGLDDRLIEARVDACEFT